MNRHTMLLLGLAVALAWGPWSDASAWAPIDGARPVWAGAVPYVLSTPGSADLGVDATETIVRQAMDDWTRVSCTRLTTSYGGRVSTRPVAGDGRSVIGWVETGWAYDSNAIGVTRPQWYRAIQEADMELNGRDYTWTMSPGRGSSVNAYSIVLHEGGHYYGLGHSSDGSATMYFAYSGGVSMINADDQNGICALYPGSGTDCTTTGCPAGQTCTAGTCVSSTPMGDGTVCSPCASGADCAAGGVCLGYPDGMGYCGRACTSSADCAGDTCVNITGVGGQCVRVSGRNPTCTGTMGGGGPTGCRSDTDCAPSDRCNTSTGACEARPVVGGPLGAECGTAAECTSGLCLAGRCSQTCDWLTPTSCPAGFLCSGEATGSCGSGSGVCVAGDPGGGALGAACGASSECASGYCASGTCSTPCIPGGAAGCADGYACQVGSLPGCGSCQQSGTLGDPCEMNDDCTSSLCAALTGDGFCTQLCDGAGSCPTGFSCLDAGGAQVCVPDAGGLGSECATNEECLSGICADEGDARYCTRLCDPRATPCPTAFACVATSDPATRICRPAQSSGCGCSVPGRGHGARGAMLAMGLLAAFAAWRDRRRS